MFTTNLTLNLKPNSTQEFTRIIENEITPLLRKQKGFRDEISSVVSGHSEALTIVYFDTKADAENAKALQTEIELSNKMKREQAIKDATAKGQTNAP